MKTLSQLKPGQSFKTTPNGEVFTHMGLAKASPKKLVIYYHVENYITRKMHTMKGGTSVIPVPEYDLK